MTAVVLLVLGCSADTASNAPAAPSATPAPLAEHLTFHGDISGTLTEGIDVLPPTHDNPVAVPPPRSTQCSSFDAMLSGSLTDYLAVIVGVVNGKRYAVAVEISMLSDDQAYAHPGTPLTLPDNVNGSVTVYELGGQQREWDVVLGPSLQFSAVVLHADRKSGTVDAWLVWPNGQSIQGLNGTLHLQGDWRCG